MHSRWCNQSYSEECTTYIFPFTHPRGVRPRRTAEAAQPHPDFNPRTRVGCDSKGMTKYQVAKISIHAPAWGATFQRYNTLEYYRISIHAPAWGATSQEVIHKIMHKISIHAPAWGATVTNQQAQDLENDFNPRTRVGCDVIFGIYRMFISAISIHAPAWGATDSFTHFLRKGAISIHAPAWGATRNAAARADSCLFQSTHPRGVRPRSAWRVEGTLRISIHAPAWGATITTRDLFNCKRRFQSTHPRGVRRRYRNGHTSADYISIHAPAWGATGNVASGRRYASISIHAPAWGATLRSWH